MPEVSKGGALPEERNVRVTSSVSGSLSLLAAPLSVTTFVVSVTLHPSLLSQAGFGNKLMARCSRTSASRQMEAGPSCLPAA